MKNKKTEKVFSTILIIIMFGLILYPLVYWIMNPELTQMQVFLKTLPFMVGGFVSGLVRILFFD